MSTASVSPWLPFCCAVTAQDRWKGSGVLWLSSSLPEVPKGKDRSGAPPVRSLRDESFRPGLGSTPLGSRIPASFSVTQSPLVGSVPSTPGSASSMFGPASVGQPRKTTLSPAQPDPFYTRGDSQRSEDQWDAAWVTVFGFPQASASYLLLRFAQYGNILKHVVSDTGNWMHICYQSKLQARKALSKDGRIFGECIRIGVKPCTDKTVMENFARSSASPMSSVFTPPTKSVASTPVQPANYTTRFPTMRPLVPPYKAFASDYQVFLDGESPRKGGGLLGGRTLCTAGSPGLGLFLVFVMLMFFLAFIAVL